MKRHSKNRNMNRWNNKVRSDVLGLVAWAGQTPSEVPQNVDQVLLATRQLPVPEPISDVVLAASLNKPALA